MGDVNLMGTFHGLRAARPAPMVATATRGKIINVASDLGVQAAMGLGGYSATKFAVVGLTQAAALELGPAGITVNACARGRSRPTWLLLRSRPRPSSRASRSRRCTAVWSTGAGRPLCTVEDVGQLVAWLRGPTLRT